MTGSTLAELWIALSAASEREVSRIAAAYEAGTIAGGTFAEAAAARVLWANAAAFRYADLAVTAWRLATVGLPTTALGLLPPPEETERLIRAFTTIIAHAEGMTQADRARRVARSEPLDAGRTAYQEGLRARGVPAWRRVVRPDACEACASMAGDVEDIDVPFFDHPGCRCVPAPSVEECWADHVRREQLQLRTITPSGVRLSSGLTFRPLERP